MIVKMQKVTLLAAAKHRQAVVARLRKLGVLHVHAVRPPPPEGRRDLETERENLADAIRVLGVAPELPTEADPAAAPAYVTQILTLDRKKDALLRELATGREKGRWFRAWGALSPVMLQELAAAGIAIRFYVANEKAFEALPESRTVQVVREDRGSVYFVLIAGSPNERLEYTESPPPDVEPADLSARMAQIEDEITAIDRRLEGLRSITGCLFAYGSDLQRQLEFTHVLQGMGQDEQVVYLQGFCPVDCLAPIREAAREEGWAYLIEEPDDTDEAPTLIRTPGWLRIIRPVFRLMGTLPGYHEYDVSFWFLIFFSLFFALLIGDAGYGVVFLLVAYLLSRRFTSAPREPFLLMYVLSGTTIVWGAVSGTWFGNEGLARLPILNVLVVARVNSFIGANQTFMMYVCFVIGVVHLTVARAVAALNRINSLTALAELGWISILWGIFFVAGNLVLNRPLPGLTGVIFGTGTVLVIFFTRPQRGRFKGALLTLVDLPLKIIGSFSDIVSYIRLFAVGYATVVVASSFNTMALKLGYDSVLSGFLSALILLLGHGLNIALGLMGVIVHGVRLNMLEFSGHLNMQWSGKGYRPFKE